ncbi:MAG TPA: hypothetical protein VKR52_00875 [Terracidiphilus sp.]|nr:hypothetical protein [Terracidiphilus sp.]
MRPSRFELRHPALIRGLLIGAAVSTYLWDRDDVVWRFIRNSPANHELEHISFLAAAMLVGAGALLCTWADAHDLADGDIEARRTRLVQYGGEWIYAVGLASLVPLWGAALLVAGELARVLRLMGNGKACGSEQAAHPLRPDGLRWGRAFRRQAAKWGILVTMLAFAVTLVDRVADVLAAASVLVWALLNLQEGLRRTPLSG